MPQKTNDELKAIVQEQVRNSQGFLGGETADDRGRAMERYLGKPIGNEVDGRSQVVSTDTQDVIESVMPDLMGIFGSTDKLAEFEPVGSEDEEMADQASDYVNHIFYKDNEGWLVLHDFIKDSLLQINGVVKVFWDESESTETEEYSDLSDQDLATILDAGQDEEIKPVRHTERVSEQAKEILPDLGIDEDIKPEELQALLLSGLPSEAVEALRPIAMSHDVVIERKRKVRRVRVENIPPEEFLISRRARSLDDAAFTAHWTQKTVSELIEMGYDPEVVNALQSADEQEFNEERQRRFDRDEWVGNNSSEPDPTMREVRVYETYIKVDFDGDGVAEMRKIIAAGNEYEILDNDPVSEHPFESLTPIRMPHKFFGRSLADLVEDITLIKTAIWRQLLDNMYNVNNARPIIGKKVSVEDVLNNRVASPVRVDADMVAGHIDYMQTVPIGQHVYPLMEYIDTIRETRTGINRLAQGLDPNALDSTAGGINMLLGRSQQRTLMMAQVMANMGIKRLAKKILRTVIRHQDKARMIRLRGEWVDIDPRTWNMDMDLTVNVGLGTGTQDQQQAGMAMLAQYQEKLIQLQGGVDGPFIFPHNIFNTAAKFGETIGIKAIEPFISEVKEGVKIERQPDADTVKAQVEGEKFKAEHKLAMDKAQFESEMAKRDLKLKGIETKIRRRELALKEREAEMEPVDTSDEEAKKRDFEADQNARDRQVELAKVVLSKDENVGEDPQTAIGKAMTDAAKMMTAPKQVVRDGDGEVIRLETVKD